jgi:hypothetical protein
MAGPYTRVAAGDPGNSGATSATTIVNAHSTGLERLEGSTLNALDYGVVPDSHPIAVAFTSGNATVSAMTGLASWPTTFTADDVGKAIWINGGSSSGNKWHYTTISSVAPGGATAVVASAPTATSTYQSAVVGTDNTTAINTFLAAAEDYDTLLFPRGDMLTQGGHELSAVGVHVRGVNNWSTRLVTAHNNHVITRTGAVGNLSDLMVVHAVSGSVDIGVASTGTGWPTAGSGLRVTTAPYDGGHTDGCIFIGMYRGVMLETGVHAARNNFFINSVRAGVECWNPGYPDFGGYTITGNSFSSVGPGSSGGVPSCEASVWWRGSGALMVSNNNIAGGQNMVYLRNDAATGMTGNVIVSNNSLEDWAQGTGNGHAVYIDQWNSDAGYLAYISITGNVLQTNSSANAAFRFVASSDPTPDGFGDYGIRAVSVSGNAGKFTGFLVDATRVRDLSVMGNTVMGVVPANQVTQTSCTNVTVA